MNYTSKTATVPAAKLPTLELRDLAPAGEELSSDEIDLVAGGLRSCPVTKPTKDDFTCSNGFPD